MTEHGNLINALRIVGRGFLLGVGFSVALGLGSVVIGFLIQHQMQSITKTMKDPMAATRGEEDKNLELLDVEEKKEGARDYVIGTLKNNGEQTLASVQIEVDMFKAGKFVDQYSTYVSRVGANSSQYFKIECGCSNGQPADHDSFKASVKNSF